MSKKFLFIVIVCLMFNVFFYTNTFAVISNNDVVLDIYPRYPKINEEIRAKVSSYLVNTDNSFFIWYLNNEVKSSGVGKNSFIFKISNNNIENILNVEIQTTDGKVLNKSINLNSGDVDLVWEAIDSYSPPFYKGKTLFAKEGEVKVIAIPTLYSQNAKLSPHTLSYNWEKDGNKVPFASGFGKNYFIYKNTFLNNFNKIKVNVSDLNNQTEIQSEINIIPFNPKILFYKKNNLGLRMEKTFDNGDFISKEGETITAVPYFFTPSFIYSSNLDISWSINGNELKTPTKDEISIKPQNENSGESIISVYVTNPKTLYQELEKSIKVNF